MNDRLIKIDDEGKLLGREKSIGRLRFESRCFLHSTNQNRVVERVQTTSTNFEGNCQFSVLVRHSNVRSRGVRVPGIINTARMRRISRGLPRRLDEERNSR